MNERPDNMDRLDALELKCALLEAQMAEAAYSRLLKVYQDKSKALFVKYSLGPADRLDFETGEIIRVTPPVPLSAVPAGE